MEKVNAGVSVESLEMKEVFEKLETYVAQGYLLHGSKTKTEILEPRQASDNDKTRTEGNLLAVYATSDIRIPLIMAVLDKKDPTKSQRAFYSAEDRRRIRVGGNNMAFTPGYVYVLPKETFETIKGVKGSETISREPVTPVDIIRVTPEILDCIPGITYEIDNMKEI